MNVPVESQIVVEVVVGLFLLFFLWFVISVLREIRRRIKVHNWVRSHPSEVSNEQANRGR
jgi:hypothetical protein